MFRTNLFLMMKLCIVLCLAAAVAAERVSKEEKNAKYFADQRSTHSRPENSKEDDMTYSRPNIPEVDYFDCSGKPNGNYPHPFDCTRYIFCVAGHAVDMACCDCNLAYFPERCDGSNWYRWNRNSTYCEQPVHTPCDDGGICDSRKEGDACDKNDCEHCGFCKNHMSYYFRCQRTEPSDPKEEVTGVIVLEKCDSDLWWNPDLKPDNVTTGGACDVWANLSEEVKTAYRTDAECVVPNPLCEWGQDEKDKCTGKYWFHDPQTMEEGKRVDMSCNEDLIWDSVTETCRERANVNGC